MIFFIGLAIAIPLEDPAALVKVDPDALVKVQNWPNNVTSEVPDRLVGLTTG